VLSSGDDDNDNEERRETWAAAHDGVPASQKLVLFIERLVLMNMPNRELYGQAGQEPQDLCITDKLGPKTVNSNRPHDAQAQSTRESQQRKKEKVSNNTHLIHVHLSGPYQLIYLSKNSHQLK
jgi:hypothetical protein